MEMKNREKERESKEYSIKTNQKLELGVKIKLDWKTNSTKLN